MKWVGEMVLVLMSMAPNIADMATLFLLNHKLHGDEALLMAFQRTSSETNVLFSFSERDRERDREIVAE